MKTEEINGKEGEGVSLSGEELKTEDMNEKEGEGVSLSGGVEK